MLLEILLAIGAGIGFGIITGLIPGVHVNLITTLIITLVLPVSPLQKACFILSLAVVHTFLDTIPSIYLGAPESDTVLGVLPGHRYLLQGNGYMAVKLTLVGSLCALLLSVFLLPLLIFLVGWFYPLVQPYIGYLIGIIMLFMLGRDKHYVWATFVFFASGMLGITLFSLHISQPLFPLLSGLFGSATLLYSLSETSSLPIQKVMQKIQLRWKETFQAVFGSTLAGGLTSIFPGLGAAQGAVLALQFLRNLGDHGFMILMGGISTANFILSLATLYALDKARNGAVLGVQSLIEIDLLLLILFAAIVLIAGGIGTFLGLFFGRVFTLLLRIPYKPLVLSVVLFLFLMTWFLSGWLGIVVFVAATGLGLVPAVVKCGRTHAMGCLLVPVLTYFL